MRRTADSPEPMPADAAGDRSDTTARRRGWSVVRWFVAAAFVAVVLLQTPLAATWLGRVAADRLVPEGLQVHVDRVGWFPVLGLDIEGLAITDSQGGDAFAARRVEVEWDWPPFFLGRPGIGRLTIEAATLTLQDRPGQGWGLLPAPGEIRAGEGRTEEAPQPERGLALGSVTLRSSRVVSVARGASAAPAGWSDTTAIFQDLQARASDVVIVLGGVEGTIDELTTDIRLGLASPDFSVALQAAGDLTGTALALSELTLRTADSEVDGGVRIDWSPIERDRPVTVDGEFSSPALRSGDIRAFSPAWAGEAPMEIQGRLSGPVDSLTVHLSASAPTGGTLRGPVVVLTRETGGLEWDLEIERLDPRVVLGPDGAPGRLSGRTTGVVRGERPDRWSGALGVALQSSRLFDVEVRGAQLDLDMADGEGAGPLSLEVRDAAGETVFNGTLTTRPFDSLPAYAFTGNVVRGGMEGAGGDRAIRGFLDLDVRGADPETLALAARIRSDPGAPNRIGRSRLDRLALEVGLDGGRGRWTVGADIGGGRVDGRGRLGLQNGGYTADAEVLSWTELDVAALAGDTTPSRVDGTASVTFRGGADGPLRSEGRARIGRLRYGPVRVDTLRASWSMDGPTLTSDLIAWVDGGRAEARLDGRGLDDRPSLVLTGGSVSRLDLGALLPAPDSAGPISTSLTGTFRADWEGRSLAEGRGSLLWRLANARIMGLDSVSGEGTIGAARGALSISGAVRGSETRLDLNARIFPFEPVPSWGVERMVFESLRPESVLPEAPAVSLRLDGSVTGAGTGLSFDSAVGSLDVRLDGSEIGSVTVRDGQLALAFGNRRTEVDLDAGTDAGRIRGSGWTRWDADSTAYEVALTGHRPADTAAAFRARLQGMGTTPARLDATLAIDLDTVSLSGVAVERGIVRLTARDGQLAVDTLDLHGPSLDATVTGTVALAEGFTSDLRGDVAVSALAIPNADDVQSVADGRGTWTLTGPVDSAVVDVAAEAAGVVLGGVRVAQARLSARGSLAGLQPIAGTGSVSLEELTAPSATIESTSAEFDYQGDTVAVGVQSRIDDDRVVRVDATLDPREEARTLVLERVSASLDGDQWELAGPAFVRYGDVLQVDSLDLRSADQRVLLRGRVSAEGEQEARVLVDELRLGAVSDLVGWSGLEGTLTGEIELNGTADAPRVDARYAARLGARSGSRTVVDGALDYDGARLQIDATVAQPSSGDLSLRGSLPGLLTLPWGTEGIDPLFAVGEGTVDVRIASDSLGLAWLRPFLDPAGVENIAGTLTTDIRVDGTASAPRLSGSTRFHGGAATLPFLGTTWRGVAGAATLDGSTARLDSLRLRSGDGAVTATGSVTFSHMTVGEFDVALRADAFRAVDNNVARATLSGTGTLSGTTARPALDADIQLLSTDVHLGRMRLGSQARDVVLTEDDYEQLREVFGTDYRTRQREPLSVMDSLALNVSITLGRDTWVRQAANPEMALQMTGAVRLSKARADSLQLLGEIEAIPQRSFVEQFGRRFQLTEGTVRFAGKPMATRIDVQGAYRVPSARNPDEAEVTIQLGVQGTPERIDLLLDSEPAMENADIVSYLATGRPAAQYLDMGDRTGNGVTGVATDLAVGAVANAIEGAAAEQVGLDVIDLETDGLQGATLVAGRYVSPALFVGFRQPLTTGSGPTRASRTDRGSEVELEYQALRWLLLNLQAGGRGFDFLLRSRVAY